MTDKRAERAVKEKAFKNYEDRRAWHRSARGEEIPMIRGIRNKREEEREEERGKSRRGTESEGKHRRKCHAAPPPRTCKSLNRAILTKNYEGKRKRI